MLGGVSVDELRRAWAEYQTTGPRSQSGRLARPDAGALYGRIIAARVTAAIINSPPRVQIAAPAPEPRMSGARAAEILAEVGFRPKEFAVPPVTPKEHLK